MAVHAAELLDTAVICADLPTALADCRRTVATTGRDWPVSDPPLSPREGAAWLSAGAAVGPVACVFGPEDRGLNNAELALCQRLVRIPTSPAYPSLNLAQAVAICAYELFEPPALPPPFTALPPAAALEGFYAHLEQTLCTIGYLQPHTAARRMEKFRRLFNRAELNTKELALLRGILRQVNWASNHHEQANTDISEEHLR